MLQETPITMKPDIKAVAAGVEFVAYCIIVTSGLVEARRVSTSGMVN